MVHPHAGLHFVQKGSGEQNMNEAAKRLSEYFASGGTNVGQGDHSHALFAASRYDI